MEVPNSDKYTLKGQLAHQACYTVYDAVDRKSGYPVHLKVLDKELSDNESDISNFLGNARIIKHLNHPNIINIVDLGHDPRGEFYYVACEPNQLESLSALILDEFSLSLEDLLEIFSILGKTLRNAHLHGLVHGFLNPDSIYIKPDGAIKIDDFGFSWSVPAILEKRDKESLYLAHYIAPEYYHPGEPPDGRADIYSMGIILHQLLTSKHPFAGNTIEAIKTSHLKGVLAPINVDAIGLPRELENVVTNAVNSNRELRFQNVREFLQALEALKKVHLPDSANASITNEVEIALAPSYSEKYFGSDPSDEPEHKKLELNFSSVGPILSKKFALTGAGALFLVILILFVTNYIPLPFLNTRSGSVDGLQDYDPSAELGVEQDDSRLNQTNNPESQQNRSPGEFYEGLTEPANGLETDRLLAAENQKPKKSKPARTEKPTTTREKKGGRTNPAAKQRTPDKIKKSAGKPPKSRVATKPTTQKPATRNIVPPPKPEPGPLKTASVSFYVKSNNQPMDANVFVDNRFVGKTSRSGALVVHKLHINKRYNVKVSKEGYTTRTQKITVKENMPTVTLDIKAKNDQFGTVLIDAVPRADQIFIDGVLHKGPTPARVSLKSGPHTIRLVNARLKVSHEQKIDLKIGQVLRVKHDFTQKEVGRVAISLKNAAQYGFGYVYVDGKPWPQKHNTTPLKVQLPVGSHTIEVKRDGFNSVPKDVIVKVEKDQTKYVSFVFMRVQP
ncbi:MAG: PEGA domain-containing protein [bacterium]